MSELDILLRKSLEREAKSPGSTLAAGRGRGGVAIGQPIVQVEVSDFGKFREMGARASNMVKAYRRIGRLMQRMVSEEFDKESKRGPRGGFTRWKKTKAFGSRGAPKATLHRSGDLAAAWAGKGGDSVFRVRSVGVTIGVNTPYAAFVRAGWTQQVTQKQRAFLGLEFGVWMKPGKTITSPARPHAEFQANRAFINDALLIMACWAAGSTEAQIASAQGEVRVA